MLRAKVPHLEAALSSESAANETLRGEAERLQGLLRETEAEMAALKRGREADAAVLEEAERLQGLLHERDAELGALKRSARAASGPPSGGRLNFTSPISGVKYEWVREEAKWEVVDDTQSIEDAKKRAEEISKVPPKDTFPEEDEASAPLDETVLRLDTDGATQDAVTSAIKTGGSDSAVLESGLLTSEGRSTAPSGATVIAVAVAGEDGAAPMVKISARPQPEGQFDASTYGRHRIWIKAGGVSILDRVVNFKPADHILPAKRYQYYNSTTNGVIGGVTLDLSLPDGTTRTLQQQGTEPIAFPVDIQVTGEVLLTPRKDGFRDCKPERILWLGGGEGSFKGDYEEKKVFMSQPLDANEIRVILRWGVQPEDLDLVGSL